MDVVSYVIGKETGGGSQPSPTYQTKDVTITENKVTQIKPDTGYDGLSQVNVTTNVPSGVDINDYLVDEISHNTSYDIDNYYSSNMIKKTAPLKLSSEVTSLNYCFTNNYAYAYQFDKENFDTSNITNMANMFSGNRNIQELDLNFFNTSNVTDFQNMFSGCINLKKLDLSSFTKKANYIYVSLNYMFQNCTKLAILDISSFDLNNINQYNYVFQNCGNQCLQSDGAYEDGKPYIYVKNSACQDWVIARRSDWTTDNVVIKE